MFFLDIGLDVLEHVPISRFEQCRDSVTYFATKVSMIHTSSNTSMVSVQHTFSETAALLIKFPASPPIPGVIRCVMESPHGMFQTPMIT